MKPSKNNIKDYLTSVLFIILKAIAWILGAVAIYWLLLKITGHSPTSEAVMMVVLSILTALVSLCISIVIKMNREVGEVKRDVKYIKGLLYTLVRDFKTHSH